MLYRIERFKEEPEEQQLLYKGYKKHPDEPGVKKILKLFNCGVRADSKRSILLKTNRLLQNWVEAVEGEEILRKFSSVSCFRRGKHIVIRVLDIKKRS